MKLATVTYNLTKEGHHVVRENVTPAEHLLIVAEHHANSGGKPVVEVKETGTAEVEEVDEKGAKKKRPRSPAEEVARLRQRYAGNKVSALFQGAIPNMPASFKEAEELGVKTVLPSSKLTEFKVV